MGRKRGAGHSRRAHHPDELKRSLISRLNRIEGQVRGIGRMVESDVYCDDVLHQIRSVDAALTGVKKALLEAHMKSCVVEQIRDGKDDVVDEIITTIGKLIR